MSDEKLLCLTLDLENDWYFDEPGYDHLTLQYLDDFIELIQELEVPLSVFVVGETLEKYPGKIDHLAAELDCEFHLHSYSHDVTKSYDFRKEIQNGKRAYRIHFGHDPTGYRAPQGNIDPGELRFLEEEGFTFDSSIFPSYRPGVYNNLNAPLTPYRPPGTTDLLELPLGVFQRFRIPVSHSYFQLFGRPLCHLLSAASLSNPLIYNVHLQDLYRTASHDRLPTVKRLIHKRNLERSVDLLRATVRRILSKGYTPVKISELASSYR